jgi:hypothetical protein
MPVGMQFGRAGTMGDIKKRNEDVSDDEDDDSETRSHIAIKQEFEKKEKEYQRRIKNMQQEKLYTESIIKNLDNDINAKRLVSTATNPLYMQMDEESRKRVELKDA